jgi:hypothetical protein
LLAVISAIALLKLVLVNIVNGVDERAQSRLEDPVYAKRVIRECFQFAHVAPLPDSATEVTIKLDGEAFGEIYYISFYLSDRTALKRWMHSSDALKRAVMDDTVANIHGDTGAFNIDIDTTTGYVYMVVFKG